MANNGIYYSSAHTLNFTTTGTTWATLTSGGTFEISTVSATTYLNLPPTSFTGGTVSGPTNFTGGLSANTFSATTYLNLPPTSFTGGTVSGPTNFTGGLSANTFSATTYLNLPPQSGGSQYFVSATTPTETVYSGDRWFNTNTGVELVWIDDGDSSQWIQPFSVPGPSSPDAGYFTYTGLTTGQTLTWDKTYWGISGSSNVNLTLPTTTAKDGYYIIIKDEAGTCGTYRIRLTPASGTIDGNNYVDMQINYMSLTCMVRGGNWYLI